MSSQPFYIFCLFFHSDLSTVLNLSGELMRADEKNRNTITQTRLVSLYSGMCLLWSYTPLAAQSLWHILNLCALLLCQHPSLLHGFALRITHPSISFLLVSVLFRVLRFRGTSYNLLPQPYRASLYVRVFPVSCGGIAAQ